MKKVLVFGGSGQAGSYMCDHLSAEGCIVYAPWSTTVDFHSDLYDAEVTTRGVIEDFKPDEIYNFAGLMYAPNSWNDPSAYLNVNGMAPLHILEAIKHIGKPIKFFQAGSASMFDPMTIRQSEVTETRPDSPYAIASLMARDIVRMYREEQGMFACTGIFFNMESPRRKKTFFAPKVCAEAVRIKRDFNSGRPSNKMKLGSLDARRDWGWTPEYVQVAYKMLQQGTPDDFVIGTGESHTCRTFVIEALRAAGLPDPVDFFEYVDFDATEMPANQMQAVPDNAKEKLDWTAKYRMKDVVRMLVEAEIASGQSVAVGQS